MTAIQNSELDEITRITFKRPMNSERLEVLFAHIAKQTGCRVDYLLQQHHSLRWGTASVQKGMLEISGAFILAEPYASAQFRTYNLRDVTRVAGFNFETTPGYDIDQLNPSEVDLMKVIKSHVELFQ